jgi:hypothetical protein
VGSRGRRVARGIALFAGALFLLFQMDGSRQPTSGNGWRILGYQRGVGGGAAVVPLPDLPAVRRAWDKLRLDGQPAPDFARTAVYWMTPTGSLGCPAHLAGIDSDPALRAAVAVFTWALAAGCDEKVVPDSFIVAIDRDRLPPEPYVVELRDPVRVQ